MVNQFKVKPLALAVTSLLAVNQLAYSAEDDKKETEDTEVIEVTGYRGSILKAISDKRNADSIVDSIFSEDIGKNTDQNIADALSRITGVSVIDNDGEGATVSIRGADPDYTNITLNGVSLTSSSVDNAVDLSAFSSDVLSSIQVFKTATADQDEGSLGGTVVLKTPSPLSFQKNRRNLEIQGRHNEFSGEDDHKISGTISHKFFDDKFGVLVTVADETQYVRRDQLSMRWEPIDAEAGRYRLTDGTIGTENVTGMFADQVNYHNQVADRSRQSLNSTFQYKPNEDTDIKLSLSAFDQQINRDDQTIALTTLVGFAKNLPGENYYKPEGTGEDEWVADPQEDWWTLDPNSNTFTKSLNRVSLGRVTQALRFQETKNKVGTLNISHYINDDFLVELTAGYSKTDLETSPDSVNMSTGTWATISNNAKVQIPSDLVIPTGYDCSSGKCQMVLTDGGYATNPAGVQTPNVTLIDGAFNPLDPYQNHLQLFNKVYDLTEDENKSIFLDFDWDVDYAGLTKIEFGGKWSERSKVTHRESFNIRQADSYYINNVQREVLDDNGNVVLDADGNPQTEIVPERTLLTPLSGGDLAELNVVDVAKEQLFSADGFMDGLVGTDNQYTQEFLNGWYQVDVRKAVEQMFYEDVAFDNIDIEPSSNTNDEVELKNFSLYFKTNFSYLDDRLQGNLGVRYVHTETAVPEQRTAINFYSNRVWTYHELEQGGLFNTQGFACSAPEDGDRIRIDLGQEPYPYTRVVDGVAYTGNTYDSNGHPLVRPGQTHTDPSTGIEYDGTVDTFAVPPEYDITGQNPNLQCFDSDFFTLVDGEWIIGPPEIGPVERHVDLSTASELDRNRREYSSSMYHEYTEILPSLNLSYALNKDMILRFATSKTMSRPKFGDLRAGFNFSENTQDNSNINQAKSQTLDPILANNLDLSWEWYFNKTSQLSIAIFNKDFKSDITNGTEEVYVADLRRDPVANGDVALNLNDFVIPIETGQVYTPGVALSADDPRTCLPDRIGFNEAESAAVWVNQCELVNLNFTQNSLNSNTRGLEFTYRQSYDFLPGAWSGLGMNFNYTWAKSEVDEQVNDVTGTVTPSTPRTQTPEHTVNTSIYWEKFGHSIRLSHRYNTVMFTGRADPDVYIWQDAKNRLDLAINYKINKWASLRLDGLNLLDESDRLFATYKPGSIDSEGVGEAFPIDDSSVFDGRTIQEYRTGRHYRVSLRLNF